MNAVEQAVRREMLRACTAILRDSDGVELSRVEWEPQEHSRLRFAVRRFGAACDVQFVDASGLEVFVIRPRFDYATVVDETNTVEVEIDVPYLASMPLYESSPYR